MKTEKSSSWHQLKRMLPFAISPFRWLSISIFGAVIAAVLRLAAPYFLLNLTDTALAGELDRFLYFVQLSALALLVNLAFTYINGNSNARYVKFVVRDLRNIFTYHIQRVRLSFTDSYHSGDFVSRLNNDMKAIATLLRRVPDLVYQPLVFVLGFIYMLSLSWKMLLAISILFPVTSILYNNFIKPIQEKTRQQMESLAKANAAAQDAISGIDIVKAYNLQDVLTERYADISKDIEEKALHIKKQSAWLIAIYLLLRYIPQLVIPTYGGYLAFQGEITVGSLLAINSMYWMLILPIEEILAWIKESREAVPAIERMFEVLDQPNEPRVSTFEYSVGADKASVKFEDVTLSYDGGAKILDGLNFELQKGETVALVGSSGSGKSTILKVLCGFYQPQSGTVRLYGYDIFRTDLSKARTLISLVSQDTYLFPTTIGENIGFGTYLPTPAKVQTAAKAANAHDFIMRLPEGYDTQVGEFGSQLSGGQRQRISIARAVLKKAPILLLDEPTSALDTQSEAVVQEALNELMKDRTILVVAHRLSSLKNVDRVFVLDQGDIQESGTPTELMARDSLYKRLYQKQINSSKEVNVSAEVSYASR